MQTTSAPAGRLFNSAAKACSACEKELDAGGVMPVAAIMLGGGATVAGTLLDVCTMPTCGSA